MTNLLVSCALKVCECEKERLNLRSRAALCKHATFAPPKDSTNHIADPIGWLEAPHGTFRRNYSVSVTFPQQTVDWSIPVFLGHSNKED
jgi:hypothetical protein